MTADFLKGTSLFLIGMMGAGKSTTGQRLAQRLGYRFCDTDALVERVGQTTIADIFARQGEAAFRQLETQVLAEVSTYTRTVVATGGGIVTRQHNWSYLHHGVVIWLDPSLETLTARLQGSTERPLLRDGLQRLRVLQQQRQGLYAQADVHVAVAAADGLEQVCDRIFAQLQQTVRPERQPSPEG